MANLIIAGVEFLASSMSPMEYAKKYNFKVDDLVKLRDKLGPRVDTTKLREKQQHNAKVILSHFLQGHLDGTRKKFREPVFNTVSNSLRRQSHRFFKDFVEGGLKMDWEKSVLDLVGYLLEKRYYFIKGNIVSAALAHCLLGRVRGAGFQRPPPPPPPPPAPPPPPPPPQEAPPPSGGKGKKRTVKTDKPTAAAKKAAKASKATPSAPKVASRPIPFFKTSAVKPPPLSSKPVKDDAIAFSRYMRLQGHLQGTAKVQAEVRAILNRHVEAISREASLAGQKVTYDLLYWWKNKGTEKAIRAPIVTTKKGSGPGRDTFRDALIQGRRGNPKASLPALEIGSLRPSRTERVVGDGELLSCEANGMRAVSALRFGWDKVHGIPKKLFRFLNASIDRLVKEALKSPKKFAVEKNVQKLQDLK